MRELNAIGRDQEQLLLVASDGERFSVLIDDTLLKTIKENRLPDSNAKQLSPREIQDSIRSGATVQELAESSGGSVDLIERFARPVLEELAHMVDLAKSIRVEMPADRFNDVEKKPFGEVVESKLAQSGVTAFAWSAKRGENTSWEITVSFEQSNVPTAATWTFDPRRYLLTPESSNAATLSTPTANIDTPLSASPKVTAAEPEPVSSVVTADKLEAFRKRREAIAPVEDEPAAEPDEPEVLDVPAIELEFEVESEVLFEELEVIDELGEETQVEPEPEPAPEVTPPPVESKKVRPPMPSWDQIVRGTQSDDGEAF